MSVSLLMRSSTALLTAICCGLALLLSACSSSPQGSENQRSSEAPALNTQQFVTDRSTLNAVSGKGKLSSEIGSNAVSLSFQLDVLGSDSLLMKFQTFGLPVGTLQATPEYFVFYSTLENRIYRGKPTRDNLARTIRVPLNYDELSTLFLGNIPGGNMDFSFYETQQVENDIANQLYVRSGESFVERVGINHDGSRLVEYSRKLPDGPTLMVSRFSEFLEHDGFELASRITASFPAYDAKVIISFDEVTCNQRASKYWFAIPSDVEVLELK